MKFLETVFTEQINNIKLTLFPSFPVVIGNHESSLPLIVSLVLKCECLITRHNIDCAEMHSVIFKNLKIHRINIYMAIRFIVVSFLCTSGWLY